MKTNLTLMAAISASVFCLVPVSHAEPLTKAKKRVEVIASSNNQKRSVATATVRGGEKRESFGAEVGTNAPHQERNPTDHPELFQIKP